MINSKTIFSYLTDEELVRHIWQNNNVISNICLVTELCYRLEQRLDWIDPVLLQHYGYADFSALIADLDMLAQLRNSFNLIND